MVHSVLFFWLVLRKKMEIEEGSCDVLWGKTKDCVDKLCGICICKAAAPSPQARGANDCMACALPALNLQFEFLVNEIKMVYILAYKLGQFSLLTLTHRYEVLTRATLSWTCRIFVAQARIAESGHARKLEVFTIVILKPTVAGTHILRWAYHVQWCCNTYWEVVRYGA